MIQLYLMKDVARLSGQSIYTLKFYLNRGLLKEVGRSPETRFRYFDDSTLKRLEEIRALRKQGKGLAEIQRLLNIAHGAGPLSPGPSAQPRSTAR